MLTIAVSNWLESALMKQGVSGTMMENRMREPVSVPIISPIAPMLRPMSRISGFND